MTMSEGYCSFRFIEQVIKNTKNTIIINQHPHNSSSFKELAETLVPHFHNYTSPD